MPGEHARLSPSASGRWLQCPGSVRLVDQLEVDVFSESKYADEGTKAHRAAELRASIFFGLIDQTQYDKDWAHWQETVDLAGYDADEMARHADAYVELITEFRDEHPHSQILLEQRVDTGVTGCWGTVDCAIISPTSVHVIDYKYGMGIPVHAADNSQLKLYGLGALAAFDGLLGQTETVCTTIHQPRLNDVSHACYTVPEIIQWRDKVVSPRAALALSGEGYLSPSESACRFCPAAGECRVRAEFVTRRDFGNPDLLSPAELSEIHDQLDDIEAWCKAVREVSLHKAYNEGIEIPGYKVVRSGGRRSISDPARAIELLTRAGFDRTDIIRESTRTLGDLERIAGGKQALSTILGSVLSKSEGKESLVPIDDPRPAINALDAAREDFSD